VNGGEDAIAQRDKPARIGEAGIVFLLRWFCPGRAVGAEHFNLQLVRGDLPKTAGIQIAPP
jgi:hypothetical protein